MPIVAGIQFNPVTKIYHFGANHLLDLASGDYVIVETAKGAEIARVVEAPHIIDEQDVVGEMKNIVRRASAWDLVQRDLWTHKEQEALAICRNKAREHELDIKIVRCDYNYTGGRLLVYFSSENRVDFRQLVRELARIFRTRIEMRQIGVRDEAKLLDGVGKCGRQLCCTSWLREFTPVSIRMAKNQQLPLNPEEISGVCGRLLCCLSYEDEVYKEQNRKMPKLGSEVITPQGTGRVRHLHPLKETVTVLLESNAIAEFPVGELISSKSNSGSGCSTCGGCTVKRRASAEEDNARVRRQRATESPTPAEPTEEAQDEESGDRNKRKRRRGGRRRA
ncbi:MAG: stage 0 sporulation family protein [Caldilineaceae bacterium]|nr:stage 0 sporulation family protein [Caldilineaceae bacterium]